MAAENESLAADAVRQLPERRPASLYDIAVQYSILDWYQTVTSGELEFDLDPEHLTFMTPMAKPDLYDEDHNVLAVFVDLSDEQNPKFKDENPVQFLTVDQGKRYELGHSYPSDKTSSMTDYSITTHKEASEKHLSGELDEWWGTGNIQDRFTEWAHSEAAETIVEQDEGEVWILEALQHLGESSDNFQELLERSDFPLDPEEEDEEHEVFITVRVKLPSSDGYLWPGEIPILNDVMVEQKAERFENVSVEDAAGEGAGYVSGGSEHVTGGSAGILGMYGKKQREHFPDLSSDGSEAWRSRPITHETAAAIATANSVFEEFYQGLGENRRLYILPYLGAHPDQISPDEFNSFASDVFEVVRSASDSDFETTVSKVFFEREEDDEEESASLGLFTDELADPYTNTRVASVFVVTGNPNRVFFETLHTDMFRPLKVSSAHKAILSESVFAGSGVFMEARTQSDSPLLRQDERPRRAMALFGGYFEWTTAPTRTSDEAEGTPKAGDIDDVRSRRLEQFLTGGEITTATLVEEYLHRLVQDQRELFGEESDYEFPIFKILEQYAQLRALDRIGALASQATTQFRSNGEQAAKQSRPTIATVTEQQPSPEHESRDDRLDEFLTNHEVLSESDSHQAVFVLGGLVGRISAYQRQNNVSSTLVRRYPIDYLTKQSVKEVTNEVLQMNNTYIESDDELPPTYNARYVDRLPNLMLSADPKTWKFPQSELQWVYALGIAYGMKDTQTNTEENNE